MIFKSSGNLLLTISIVEEGALEASSEFTTGDDDGRAAESDSERGLGYERT